MRKDQRGTIFVDAALGFVFFYLVCTMFMSIVRLEMFYNRVQYALSQTASELSSYLYLYAKTGLYDKISPLVANTNKYNEKMNTTWEASTEFYGDVQTVFREISGLGSETITITSEGIESAKSALSDGFDVYKDIKTLMDEDTDIGAAFLYSLCGTAGFDALEQVCGIFAGEIFKKYLTPKESMEDFDKHLDIMQISDLYFTLEGLFDDNETLALVARYQIRLPIGSYWSMGKELETLSVTQRAITKAWLKGGD